MIEQVGNLRAERQIEAQGFGITRLAFAELGFRFPSPFGQTAFVEFAAGLTAFHFPLDICLRTAVSGKPRLRLPTTPMRE